MWLSTQNVIYFIKMLTKVLSQLITYDNLILH